MALTLAADEPARIVVAARLPHPRQRVRGAPALHGRRLALCQHRRHLLVLDRVARRAIRDRAHEDAVDRRRGLQAGGGVHDVARDEALARGRIRVQLDERLTGVHADADVQAELGIPLVRAGERLPDRECGADRALGIVLVRGGRAEHGHHGIAVPPRCSSCSRTSA